MSLERLYRKMAGYRSDSTKGIGLAELATPPHRNGGSR